ncbi:hypothetical protein [Sporosarcina koreensis]|uniref:hypothetical protein n=1 Tax=Sporosarcina koreensis TaxID=334735 RepID=UPI0007576A4F|nr:hypothetical protein [Sporosarcina koreensis]
MKNLLKSVGVVTFGLSVALVLSPLNAGASEEGLLVDVNVLSKEDGKSSVLDVEILDVPIVGDINVNIPSTSEIEASEALAAVEVSGGVVDDLDVSVLEKTETKTSVATVELESSLTNDVLVDVVSGEKTSSTFDGGVVEVNAEDLPLLGETHVGVLDKYVEVDEDRKSLSTGLIQTDVNEGLLDEVSVDVLEMEKGDDGWATRGSSAVVDVSIDDDEGILDDLGVSVLKREEAETGTKASLVSVDLETPVTEELNVDVGLRDRTSNTFDGGLVELNVEDLPLLGETHVGVLDRHGEADEDGKSLSTGLIQSNLDGGLLEDTSIGVLVRELTATEDGQWVSESGASLDLGLPGMDAISVDVLKREQFTPVAQTDVPTIVVPPSTDEGNDDGTGENTENTLVPDVNVDLPTSPESTDDATADGNEENQGTTTPHVNAGDSGSDVDNQENGTANNDAGGDYVVNEPEQESAKGNGLSGDLNADEGFRTGELSGSADTTAILGTGQSGRMNSLAMNNVDPRSSLPKTGGFWDGKRLAFLALVLVIAGLAMMRVGKSTRLAA